MKKAICFILAALSVGCTTGVGLGDKDAVWYGHTTNALGIITWTEVYYCDADKDESGKPRPKCYEATKDFQPYSHPGKFR